jgi:uncharacterized cupredoxin-like copper-binding protein
VITRLTGKKGETNLLFVSLTATQCAGLARNLCTMKKIFIFISISAVAVSLNVVRAEGPAEKAGEVAQDTVDTAKNVGHSVVKGTKKAAQKVADALTPESDARVFNVTLTEYHIDMAGGTKPGKTAFVVKNEGKQKHSFEVVGNGTDDKFLTDVAPGQTKVLHVRLTRGTYRVYCPVDGHRKKGMETKLTVK